MAPGSAKVLDQVLKLIDAYDLYGSVAYPKRHTQDDISDIYLLPAATRGVFINIALQVRGCSICWGLRAGHASSTAGSVCYFMTGLYRL
jgi:hypothetical protein